MSSLSAYTNDEKAAYDASLNTVMLGSIRKACGSGGVWGPAACSTQFGSEVDYAGEASSNGLCVAKCQKTRYAGKTDECCILGESVQGSCDPNQNCDQILGQYCKYGDNVLSAPACNRWVNKNSANSAEVMLPWAKANITNTDAQAWLQNNKAVADPIVQAWCATPAGASSSFCSCINSKLAGSKLGINPRCVDAACMLSGYITQSMAQANCPDITNCEVQNTLINSGVALGVAVNSTQNCTSSPSSPTDTTTTTPTVKVNTAAIAVGIGLCIALAVSSSSSAALIAFA